MPLACGDHAPFALRHLIDDGSRCLPFTTVIDTWEGWMDRDLSKALIHYYNTSLSWKNYYLEVMTTPRILRSAQDDNAPFVERLLYRGNCSLISSHNLPPAEANTRERGVGWGPFTLSPRQRSPDPGRGASPPAPPLYD